LRLLFGELFGLPIVDGVCLEGDSFVEGDLLPLRTVLGRLSTRFLIIGPPLDEEETWEFDSSRGLGKVSFNGQVIEFAIDVSHIALNYLI